MTRVRILFLLPMVAFVGAQLRPTANRPLRPQVQVLQISTTTTEAPVRTTQREVTASTTQAPIPVVFSSTTPRSGYLRSLFARPRPGDSIILPTERSEPSTFAPMITKPARSFTSTQPPTLVSSPTVQLPATFFPSQPPIITEVNIQTTEADLLITKSPDGFNSAKKDIDEQLATTEKNDLTETTTLPFQDSTETPSSTSPITEAEPIFVSKFPLEPIIATANPLKTTTLEPKSLVTQTDQEPTFTILDENVQNLRPTMRPRPQTMKPFVESSTTVKSIETTTLEQILPEVKTEVPTFINLDKNIENLRPTMRPRPQTMKPFVESSTTAKSIETTTLEQILPEMKTENPTFINLDKNIENLRPTMRPRPQTMKPFVEPSSTAKSIDTTTLEQILPEVKTEDPTFINLDKNIENLRPTMRPRPQTMKPFVEASTAAKPIETTTLEQILPEVKTEDPTFINLDKNIENLRPTMRPRPQTLKPFVEASTAAKPIETTTLEEILPEVKTEDPTFINLDKNIENLRPTMRPIPQTMKPFVESSSTAKFIETTTLEQILPEVKTEDPTFINLDKNIENLRPTMRPRPQTMKPFVEASTTAKSIETTTLEQILPEVKTEDPTFINLDKNIENLRPTMRPRPQTMKPFVEPSTTAKSIEASTLEQILPELKTEDPTFINLDKNIENLRPTMRPRPQTMKPFVEASTTAKSMVTTTLEQISPEVKTGDPTFINLDKNIENLRPTMRPRPQTMKPLVEASTTAKPIENTTLQQILPETEKEGPISTILDENLENLRQTIRPQTVKPFVEPTTTVMPIETLQQKIPEAKKEDSFTFPVDNFENLRPTIRPRPQTMKPFVEPNTTTKSIVAKQEDPTFTVDAENVKNPRPTLRPRPQTMKPFVESNTTAKPIETTTSESKRPISFDEENVFITTFRPLTRPTPATLPIQTTTTTKILLRPRPIPPPDSSTRSPIKTTSTPAPTTPFKTEGCPSGVNAYFPVSNECDTYIECKKNVATKYSCPDGLHFNRNAVYPNFPCSYPSEVTCEDGAITQPAQPNGDCPRQYGFFSRPDGICDSYIMCEGGKAQIMKCPPGLAFNPDKSNCDWPANVPSCNLNVGKRAGGSPNVFKGFSCPTPPLDENGKPSDLIYKFKYGNSCHEYVACHRQHPRLLRCDTGLSFDESSETCIDSDLVANCSNAL